MFLAVEDAVKDGYAAEFLTQSVGMTKEGAETSATYISSALETAKDLADEKPAALCRDKESLQNAPLELAARLRADDAAYLQERSRLADGFLARLNPDDASKARAWTQGLSISASEPVAAADLDWIHL